MNLSQRQIVYLICCMEAHDNEGNFIDPLRFSENSEELEALRDNLKNALTPKNIDTLRGYDSSLI